MERPKGITILAIVQAVLAAALLLLLIPGLKMGKGFSLFGSPVSASTFGWWTVLVALTLLFFGHCFWRGIALGFYAYAALKPAGWIVLLVQGVGPLEIGLIVVEVGLLAYVAKNRAWFRN